MISPVKIWRNQKKIRTLLGREGKILTWTKVFVPPSGFEGQAPYIVAIAQLDDKTHCTAQLVDYDEKQVKIGQRVRTVLRKTRDPGTEGVIPYGVKFKPI